jgi:hypothetical protein
LQLFREIVGPDTLSSQVGLASLVLGQSLLAAGKDAEARGALQSALQHLEATLGADHAETRRARQLTSSR